MSTPISVSTIPLPEAAGHDIKTVPVKVVPVVSAPTHAARSGPILVKVAHPKPEIKTETSESDNSLKRLGFVAQGTEFAYAEVQWLYNALRSWTPAFFTPSLVKVENTLLAVAAPYVSKAEQVFPQVLHFADDKVDKALSRVGAAKSKGNKDAKYAYGSVSAAVETYLNFISGSADYAVERLNVKGIQVASLKAVEAARDTVQAAVAKARNATTDPDAAVALAWDAWTNFASLPPVAFVLETAEPATKLGLQAFNKLHNSLVATPLYKSVLDHTAHTIGYATSTTPYKLGAQYLYPMVSPVADPTIAKVANSKSISAAFDYWKPAAVAAH